MSENVTVPPFDMFNVSSLAFDFRAPGGMISCQEWGPPSEGVCTVRRVELSRTEKDGLPTWLVRKKITGNVSGRDPVRECPGFEDRSVAAGNLGPER